MERRERMRESKPRRVRKGRDGRPAGEPGRKWAGEEEGELSGTQTQSTGQPSGRRENRMQARAPAEASFYLAASRSPERPQPDSRCRLALAARHDISISQLPPPAMWVRTALLSLLAVAQLASASPYREDLTDYNININKNAQSPTDYTTNKRSSYTASPPNWRAVPFYTVLMDKFADGDPSNNDWFGTMYEWDWRETQLRFGGDLKGLVSKLDYLQGMGIKGIFVSGTPFINMLWQADSESSSLSTSSLALHVHSSVRLFAPRFHPP